MKIRQVSVDKLFGNFDYEIPLNVESRITIVQAPNGYGKTILLTMLNGLFDSKYQVFHDIPFDEFRVQFVGGELITVKKPTETETREQAELTIDYDDKSDAEYESFAPKSLAEYKHTFEEEVDSISDISQFEGDLWFKRSTGELLTMEEVIEEFDLYAKLYGKGRPDWFTRVTGKLHTRFIQAHRLQSRMTAPNPFRGILSGTKVPKNSGYAVDKYSDEIAKSIQDIRSEYGVLSQRRDGSFPDRVIAKSGTSEIDEAIQDRLRELEKKRHKLIQLGLLDKDTHENPESDETVENLATAFFSTYIQDSDVKLAVFDDMSRQVTKLMEIVNRRFQFKTLSIDKEKGFLIQSDKKQADDDSDIPIASLSSGEQHELVLMYQLLFHVKSDSLILIDEPELSLHVTWQRDFLSDIQSITALRKFDVLMATHSPQIIGERRDLTVRLRKHEEETSVDVK